MNTPIISDWEDIKDRFTHNLLLGNGASIAIHTALSYDSLYKQACASGALTMALQKLFETFKTQNFEVLLRMLLHAKLINKALDVKDENKTTDAYQAVKEALVKTVIEVHPDNNRVKNYFQPIAVFMKNFKTIFCLNYDLLVYWAMLEGNDMYGQWFKDCFINNGAFRNDYSFLRSPYPPAEGSTLVFYPHGSLFLATDFFGDEMKLVRSGEEYLLNQILSQWGRGSEIENYIPLFVTEGNADEKLRRIRASNYLDTVYDDELSTLKDSLVIYGWSISKQDAHILEALARGNLGEIAISIYVKSGDWQSKCNDIEAQIRKYPNLRGCTLTFFNAESKGCWIY